LAIRKPLGDLIVDVPAPKHRLLALSLYGVSGIFVLIGLFHTGATISDTTYLAVTATATALLATLALLCARLAHIMRKRVLRNYAAQIAICAIVVMSVPWTVSLYRVKYTRQTLESVYDALASNGPPFPRQEQVYAQYFSAHPLLISNGYYISHDRTTFEIFYHKSSDSFAMAFPDRNWKWRGNNYQGPQAANE